MPDSPDHQLTTERKAELESTARLKMQSMEREYWLVRNGKAKSMRCPYCVEQVGNVTNFKRNAVDSKTLCCALFAKAFQAIMDRQEEVDKAARHAHTIHTLGQMVGGRPN